MLNQKRANYETMVTVCVVCACVCVCVRVCVFVFFVCLDNWIIEKNGCLCSKQYFIPHLATWRK